MQLPAAEGRPLTQVREPLNGPSRQQLDVLGRFRGTLKWRKLETKQDVYVVRGFQMPLLGQPAIEALGVVTRVENTQQDDITAEFTDLFEGLGCLKDNYKS